MNHCYNRISGRWGSTVAGFPLGKSFMGIGRGSTPVDQFHAASSAHRPVTSKPRLLYDAANLYLRFRVEDRHVLAKHTQFQDPVWRDSCV